MVRTVPELPDLLHYLVVVCRGLRCSLAGLLWCGLLRVVGLHGL
jgi:hypothetical protein